MEYLVMNSAKERKDPYNENQETFQKEIKEDK